MTRSDRVEHATSILRDALATYAGKIALACSFGGPAGMVLLDMVVRLDRRIPIFYLDTGLLFPETYELVTRTRERYGVEPVAVVPDLSVEEQNERYGAALWARDPDACCALRKVSPQQRFLAGFDAWITGLRRDQSPTREAVAFVARDERRGGKTKIAPLADWSDADIWAYVSEHDVPYNPLNDRGYPSLGCTHCTRAVAPGEGPRSGRWPGFDKIECGLHPPSAPVRTKA